MRRVVFGALGLLSISLTLASVAEADCEVLGVASLERVRVRVPGQRLRTFSVQDLPVAVRPGRGGHYRDVRVLAPLSFGGRTDAAIPWAMPRPQFLAGGAVWLSPTVVVEDVREQVGREGLFVRVRLARGVWLERLAARCQEVAVGQGESSGEDAPEWGRAGGPRWQPRDGRLWFFEEPGRGGRVRMRLSQPLPSALVEVAREGNWVQVVARFERPAAALRGWVRASELQPAPAHASPPQHIVRAWPSEEAEVCPLPRARRGQYVGLARISQGAIVTTGAAGEAWASVSEPAIVTISWRTGEAWARIVHVPGLVGDGPCPQALRHAWVPRQAVTLQGEGQGPEGVPLLGLPL